MATYVVTGASRGIGFEFIRQLSKDPEATVVGLVRNQAATERTVAAELKRKNIHIVQADLTDYNALKDAVAKVSSITNGSVDYLIANGAFVSEWSAYDGIGDLAKDQVNLEKDLRESFEVNVIGNINLFNLFLPLVLMGHAKKVIAISSGMADADLIAKFDVDMAAPYSISKAALNAAVAKFSAQYRQQGVLFLSISPGVVDTGSLERATEKQKGQIMRMGSKFAAYAPHFKGPITPEESVKQVLSVIYKASIADGYAGQFISHLGNKQWL